MASAGPGRRLDGRAGDRRRRPDGRDLAFSPFVEENFSSRPTVAIERSRNGTWPAPGRADHARQPAGWEEVTPLLEMSSSSADRRKALDDYRVRLEVERITPRRWLKGDRGLAIVNGFREQLWALYCRAYPPPEVPGFVLLDVLGEGGMGQVFLARTRNSSGWRQSRI